MKKSLNRSLVAAAIVAGAAYIYGHDSQSGFVSGHAAETTIVTQAPLKSEARQVANGKYAEINGLKMYYEIHGSGQPLVLLHGAFGFAEGWAPFLPSLTKTRQVIAIELQGHGHTNDLDRPLTYEQMADDTAALLNQLKIKQADFFGYSMGGTVALALAIRHPELAGKLAIYGSCAGKIKDTYDPETYKQFQSISTDFAPPVLKEPYDRMAPDPKRWPVLVTKVKNLEHVFNGYSAKDLKAIKAQTLVMMGDRDVVRPEHAVEMYRQIPNAQLAIFPGGDHFLVFSSPEKLLSTLLPFLNAPITKKTGE